MDPAQKPAEPIAKIKPSDLVRQILSPEADPADSPEAKENRARAGAEISMIFELKDSVAFKWFEKEFIDGPYRRAFDELRSPYVKPEDLPKLQTTYVALRAIKVGMLEREITHREQIDPNDVEIARLRAELSRL
jgi:hypothetical protein